MSLPAYDRYFYLDDFMLKIEDVSEEVLRQKVNEFNAISKIAKSLGYRSSKHISQKIRERFEEFNIDYMHLFGERTRRNRKRLFEMNKNDLKDLIKESKSFADVWRETGTRKDIKKRIDSSTR